MKLQTITKCDQFTEYIREAIRKGKYPPGSRFPAERALAEKYGISHLTVNKAVASMVSMGLLDRKGGRNGTHVTDDRHMMLRKVGLVVESDPVESEQHEHAVLPHLLLVRLQEKGFMTSVLIVRQTQSENTLDKALHSFLRELPLGLVADGYSRFPFDIIETLPHTTRLIFYNRFEGPEKYPGSYILSDYRQGGYISAKHLLEAGRKKIAIFSFERNPGWTSELYYQGCLQAFKEYGGQSIADYNTDRMEEKDFHPIFSSPKRPDGILSVSDYRVLPALVAIKKSGLRIPDDIAVIGYNNTPWARAYNLTSVTLNEERIVEEILTVLETGKFVEVSIAPSLVYRSSAPVLDKGGEKSTHVKKSSMSGIKLKK